jgi:hypothetical protein
MMPLLDQTFAGFSKGSELSIQVYPVWLKAQY